MLTNQKCDFFDEDIKEAKISFLVTRLKITDKTYETLITNLCRKIFPVEELKYLYNIRWGIETAFRYLKYVIGLIQIQL